MDTKLIIQGTPNPNALKFVLNIPVIAQGNVTYKSVEDCKHNPLAKIIFELDHAVKEVYFFDNYITVSQDGSTDWDTLENKIQQTILAEIEKHDLNFNIETADKSAKSVIESSPELDKINTILDETVRPALQMDGGDIQLINYKDKNLKVFYQGACGSCPSAAMGTLQAIENILKDQFDPEISVELADTI